MKKICTLLLAMFACLTLPACSRAGYADDLSCTEILNGAPLLEGSADAYRSYDEDYIEFFIGDTSSFNDHIILYSQEQNDINEIGVFHAADQSAVADLSSAVEAYVDEIKSTQRAFIASYAPAETQKLDSAEVRSYGKYVIYAILSESDKTALFEHIDQRLKK